MKTKFMTNGGFLAVLALLALPNRLLAEEINSVDRVALKNGAVLAMRDGVYLPLTNEVAMPHAIKVMTNGTFRVHDGKERRLTEGQVLAADGILTSPDGALMPVFDHIALRKGEPVLAKDGELLPLDKDMDLADGQRVSADGYLVGKSGVRRKLLDGEVFALTGQTVAVGETGAL